MFPLLALAHRHLKPIHCLLRAAALTSADEFQWWRQLIETSCRPPPPPLVNISLLSTTVSLFSACFTARESVPPRSQGAEVIFITALASGSQECRINHEHLQQEPFTPGPLLSYYASVHSKKIKQKKPVTQYEISPVQPHVRRVCVM